MIQFTDAATAAKYDCNRSKDGIVHVPGGRKGNGWRGMISKIPVEQADRLIELKSNLLTLKPVAGVNQQGSVDENEDISPEPVQ